MIQNRGYGDCLVNRRIIEACLQLYKMHSFEAQLRNMAFALQRAIYILNMIKNYIPTFLYNFILRKLFFVL